MAKNRSTESRGINYEEGEEMMVAWCGECGETWEGTECECECEAPLTLMYSKVSFPREGWAPRGYSDEYFDESNCAWGE